MFASVTDESAKISLDARSHWVFVKADAMAFLRESMTAYALPNDASRDPMNAAEVRGNIAICHRGAVPLVHKILAVQASGAVGVVLVDDGSCGDDLECGRAGSPKLGGFAPKDDAEAWRKVDAEDVMAGRPEIQTLPGVAAKAATHDVRAA